MSDLEVDDRLIDWAAEDATHRDERDPIDDVEDEQ